MLTLLVNRIRERIDELAWERRRPILVAVRVPDTIEMCLTLGLDVETWIAGGLIDLMTVSGYFRLAEWASTVQMEDSIGWPVPIYACLSESRQRDVEAKAVYNSPEGYRSRALNAWHEGVDGIYLFNAFDPTNPMWHELGDPKKLETLSKTYFTAARGYGNVESWWKGGSKFMHRSILSPDRPRKLEAGRAATVRLLVGEDTGSAKARTLRMRFTGLEDAGLVRVTVNGTPVDSPALDGAWLTADLPLGLVHEGWNDVAVTLTDASVAPVSWLDLHLHVER